MPRGELCTVPLLSGVTGVSQAHTDAHSHMDTNVLHSNTQTGLLDLPF